MDTNIKNLIDKYYKGETSLEEEKILRDSYSSEEIFSNDPYSCMIFKTFSEERKEKTPPSIKTLHKTLNFKRKSILNYKQWLYAAAGMAACLAIIFTVYFHHNKHEYYAYVVIDGVRYDDEKLAFQYISESFEEEERIEKIALAQWDEMNRIEKELNELENQLNNIISNY